MLGNFNIPSVDHLREGIDYRILDWDFASGAPVQQPPPGQPCPPGTKMIFGLCRRLKSGTGDWDPSDESDMERAGKMKAKAEGSAFENNKPIDIGGKKYGWAKKGNKDVLVEWGSVCAKKVNGKCVSKTGVETPAAPAAPAATPAPSAAPAATSAPTLSAPAYPVAIT